ncbi:MAG: hypothetical protein ACKO9I_03850 [Sphaerospermopsis kisseleviana]|uniref:Uncharacterized protein n=1 Tax=Sphaerospermopsis reniformis TaxID=531300 RepID=A0A480A3L6_9CYAN|nr:MULTISPECIES: hypothetical protein [Sphaerospermopsis]MBD2147593.1 hypothetical protein [Sphaerospermopsis sp. FACHB-1194]GCL37861.1 hypothetical protein SR1949_29730 [Sphaerospermopsis reniformis]
MSIIKPPTAIDFDPAIVAKDKDDQPILMIDVRFSAMYASPELNILKMEKYQNIPFLMFANSDVIRIFKSPNFAEVARLDTKKVLGFYSPKSIEGIIYQFTLITLLQSWLRDLDYHWKSENPPYIEEMKEIGLFALLDDITTEELQLL